MRPMFSISLTCKDIGLSCETFWVVPVQCGVRYVAHKSQHRYGWVGLPLTLRTAITWASAYIFWGYC
jgi:hypothetical protein